MENTPTTRDVVAARNAALPLPVRFRRIGLQSASVSMGVEDHIAQGLTLHAADIDGTGGTTLNALRIKADHTAVVPTCNCHKQQGGRVINKKLYTRKIRYIMTYHKIEEYKPGNTAF